MRFNGLVEVLNTIFAGIGTLVGVMTLFMSLRDRQRGQAAPHYDPSRARPTAAPTSPRAHAAPSAAPLDEEAAPRSPSGAWPEAAAPSDVAYEARSRFFDPLQPQNPPVIQLEPVLDMGFRVTRQMGYLDAEFDEPFLFPADPRTFVTDLESVPMIFSWLVPGSASTLPARLLHDALMTWGSEPPAHSGPAVTRREADRIFRDALRDGGIGVSRRWLVWASSALATMLTTPGATWRKAVFAVWSVVITLCNVLACLHLADRNVVELPWLIDGPFLAELVSVLAGAVLIPLATSLLFGRDWKVVAIFGVGYSILFVPILLNTGVVAMFLLLDRLITRRSSRR